jgi:hypothetical protein
MVPFLTQISRDLGEASANYFYPEADSWIV